jgi:hypothetical protein
MKNLTQKVLLSLSLLFTTTLLFSQDVGVYVSDAGNFSNPPWFVWQFTESGESPVQLLDESDGIVWPEDILFIDDNNTVLVSSLSQDGIIQKYNADTWEFIENFAEGVNGPTRMEIGPDGYVYVLQWYSGDNKVLRYEKDGSFVDEFTSIGVYGSIGMDWDDDGNLYVSSYYDSVIYKFDTNGDDLGPFIDTGISGPTNIFFDKTGTGDLVVFNWNSGVIKRFDSDGNFIEDLITGVGQCEGFDFFPNGDMIIGVGFNGSIKRYDSDFNYIEDFIEPGILDTPNAIRIHEGTLSTNEFDIDDSFITPTYGTNFHINHDLITKVISIEIYNTIGLLIEKKVLNGSFVWNASNYSEGMYFIVAVSNTGLRKTQKVIVKK